MSSHPGFAYYGNPPSGYSEPFAGADALERQYLITEASHGKRAPDRSEDASDSSGASDSDSSDDTDGGGADDPPPPPKSSNHAVTNLVLALVVAGLGLGAYLFFTRDASSMVSSDATAAGATQPVKGGASTPVGALTPSVDVGSPATDLGAAASNLESKSDDEVRTRPPGQGPGGGGWTGGGGGGGGTWGGPAGGSTTGGQNNVKTTTTTTPSAATTTGKSASAAAAATKPASSNVATTGSNSATTANSPSPSGGGSSSKKGVGYNTASFVKPLQVGWAYNWNFNSDNLDPSVQYCPMMWGNKEPFLTNFPAAAQKAASGANACLLGFNEPDIALDKGGSDMDVGTAVTLWRKYMQPYAGKATLVSPGVSNGPSPQGIAWLSSFISQCTGCQIDAVSLHWYDSASNTAYFQKYFADAHATLKKPIWITEFMGTGTPEEQIKFFQTVLPWLEDPAQSYIARYAAFCAFAEGKLAHCNNQDSSLTNLGKSYASGGK